MPITERRTGTRATVARRADGHAAEARGGDAREEAITGRDTVRRPEAALGGLLRLVESGASAASLASANIDTQQWWQSQLHAYHWAIQVGRNL